MSQVYCGIIFDFDYTLADSSRGVVDCIDYALRAMGLEAVSPEQARRTIGLSLPETLAQLAGEGSRGRGEEFARRFVERAEQVMVAGTVLFEPVPKVLPLLKARGLRLGIVSAKFRYRIQATLQRDGLLDLFDVIVGGEDVSKPKPDPEGALRAVERLGLRPAQCLYVGDSVVDAETARRAGIPFVAVLSGVTRLKDLAGHPIHACVQNLAQLPGLLGLGWEEVAGAGSGEPPR